MNIITAYDINAVVTRYLSISGTNPARANAIKIGITTAYNRGLDYASYADQNDVNVSPYDAKIPAAPFIPTITDQTHLTSTLIALQDVFYNLPGVDGTPTAEILDIVATGWTLTVRTTAPKGGKQTHSKTLRSLQELR